MSTTTFTCLRPACASTLEAGDDETELRCNLCGLKHIPPWNDPQADAPEVEASSTETQPVETDVGTTASNAVTLDADKGEEMHIHININLN